LFPVTIIQNLLDGKLSYPAIAIMKYRRIIFILLYVLILTAGSYGQNSLYEIDPVRKQELNTQIRDFLEKEPLNKAHWGIIVQNEEGDTLLDYNSQKLFVPASTIKVVTAAAAWKTLGADYNIPTYLDYHGFTHNDILFGDLVVTGTGDPTLDSRHWQDPAKVFKAWSDSLKLHGISEIRGDIIGNDDFFEDLQLGNGWAWDDLSHIYSAEFGALMADNSSIEVTLVPPKTEKDSIRIIDELPFPYVNYENRLTRSDTLPAHVEVVRLPGINTIRFSGNITSRSDIIHKTVTVENPTLYYVSLLKYVLSENGIKISGNARDIDDLEVKPDSLVSLFTWHSPPLKSVISQILQDSNNQASEALLRTLAWKEKGYGSFENGKAIVDTLLDSVGVAPLDYSFKDSCGLSRYDLISPASLNKVLLYMKDIPEWEHCLSQPGKSGTLEKRLKGFEKSLHAKTGSMNGINSLSGYIYKGHKKLIFTIIVNNYKNPGIASSSDIIDHIVTLINK
jgi:D-alanyl-D-alanine carboxypeptidase/D-alanyl-D-alanine-endopeptidase (penicillin-binding protein 4)